MAASVYRIAAELGSRGGMRAILSVLALQKHNRLAFSRPLDGRAIAFGETVGFLSSVIPAQAGIERPKTRHSPLDSRLRGNDGPLDRDNSVPHRCCPKMCAARDHR